MKCHLEWLDQLVRLARHGSLVSIRHSRHQSDQLPTTVAIASNLITHVIIDVVNCIVYSLA